jgi:hypothetical protein
LMLFFSCGAIIVFAFKLFFFCCRYFSCMVLLFVSYGPIKFDFN